MTATKEYTFNCNQIVPWSGGAADDAHQRLIVWGGGHSDYAGNEVSVLNLKGTPSWERFTSPTMPVPFVWDGKHWEGLKPYFIRLHDGGKYQPGASPSSRHTYNSLQYVPYQNKLYSFGGSVANGGYFVAGSLDPRHGHEDLDNAWSALFTIAQLPNYCLQSQQRPHRNA